MKQIPFTMSIGGNPIEIKIIDDLPWSELESLINEMQSVSAGTTKPTDLFNKLIMTAVTCDKFDFKNLTEVKKLGSVEVTALIKKVLETLPLETYLNNLDMGGNLNLEKIVNQANS